MENQQLVMVTENFLNIALWIVGFIGFILQYCHYLLNFNIWKLWLYDNGIDKIISYLLLFGYYHTSEVKFFSMPASIKP